MGRVMVTGASGYLGGRLCGALVHAGHSVVALVRKTSNVQELPPEVELVEGDVGNADSVRAACRGCEYVVHAAALVGAWMPDPSQYIKVSAPSLSPFLHIRFTCNLQQSIAMNPTWSLN
jgi:farnesol dehydrogenase